MIKYIIIICLVSLCAELGHNALAQDQSVNKQQLVIPPDAYLPTQPTDSISSLYNQFNSKEPLSLEQIEFTDMSKQLILNINTLARIRFIQCLKVFGNTKYCKCINEELAIGVSFLNFVDILILEKQDIDKIVQQSKNPSIKSQIDKARAIRDKCIVNE